jgi:hypothetical protein
MVFPDCPKVPNPAAQPYCVLALREVQVCGLVNFLAKNKEIFAATLPVTSAQEPRYPAAHTQEYENTPSTQVPPFAHG